MIDKIKDLYENRDKLADMSVKAKSLDVSDTNDRIFAVVKELMKKAGCQ